MKCLRRKYLNLGLVLSMLLLQYAELFASCQSISVLPPKNIIVLQHKTNSIATLFSLIEKQTQFRIVYSLEAIDTSRTIHSSTLHVDLETLLAQITTKRDMMYSVSGNLISFKNGRKAQERSATSETSNSIDLIQGSIKDQQGQPLSHAVVRLLHTPDFARTDEEGNFSIQLVKGIKHPILLVELVGYDPIEVAVTSIQAKQLHLQLTKQNKDLEEIVITGYANQRRANYTGAVEHISGSAINDLPHGDLVDMLDGKAKGVQVFSAHSPGGGNAMAIRGLSTIHANDPLIILDGLPLVNGLNTINPNDVEHIQILKDADASMYGSRAANGVLLITTKKGDDLNAVTLALSSYAGIQYAVNLPTMLNAKQYGQLLWQAYQNDGVLPNHSIYGNNPTAIQLPEYLTADQTIRSADVNWVKSIFTPARIQSHSFSVSKGDTHAKQLFSLGYFEQKGIIKDTYFKRLTARYNSSYQLFNSHLVLGENVSLAYADQVEIGTNKALNSIVYDAYMYPSIIPVYNEAGDFSGNPINDRQNPLGRLHRNKDNKVKQLRALGNLYAQANYGDFSFKTSLGLDFQNVNAKRFSATFDELFVQNEVNALTTESRFNYEMVMSNTLGYQRQFQNQSVQLLLGQEAIQYYYEGLSASRHHFLQEDPSNWFLDYGTQNQLNSGNAYQWNLSSYFAKVSYNYKQKYLGGLLLRRDGTSRLQKHKWSNFPALSLGWRISEEHFWPLKQQNTTALMKFNWGISGNQQVPTYSTVQSFSHNNYNSNYDIDGSQHTSETGLVSTRVANPNLRWESTEQVSAGLDASFFYDKLRFTVDFYSKKTKDLLVYRSLPLTFGGAHKGQWINDGVVQNKGIEIGLEYRNSFQGLDCAFELLFTQNKNKMTRLSSTSYLTIPSSSLHDVNFGQEVSRTAVGAPIGAFYGYKTAGVFQNQTEIETYGLQPNAQPGDLRFVDTNQDGTIDHRDRTQIGTPHPKFTASLSMNFAYKNIELQLFWIGSYGNEIYNLTKYQTHFFNQEAYNKSTELLGAWTVDNPNSSIPRLTRDDPNNNIRPSSYYIEDGSFLKLSQLQVAYSFESKRYKKAKFRLYFQVSNVFTLTKYSGVSPEVGFQNYASNNRSLDLGVDRGLYPPAKTMSLGFTISY